MNKAISQRILQVLAIFALAFSLVYATAPAGVMAQNTDAANKGLEWTGADPNADAEGSLKTIIETIVDILSLIVGAVSVIMIIVGGLRYITSGGDAQSTAAARNTILYAVVGLVVAILAQVIVGFVINNIG